MLDKIKSKKILLPVGLVVLVLLAIGGAVVFRDMSSQNSSFSAQLADNVVRPLIGNVATIKLETAFFNIQDKIHQMTYKSKDTQDDSGAPKQFISDYKETLKWKPATFAGGETIPALMTTMVYPDSSRPYAFVHLVLVDMSKVEMGAVAGIKEPAAEVGMPGPGMIPADLANSNRLVAAFNGGFQYRDGQYGMVVGSKTYLPLQEGLASLFVDYDSKVSIQEYSKGMNLDNYKFVRQNGQMLIKDGVVIPSSKDKLAKIWGRSVTSNMYTWRSGVGVRADGSLVYAVGPSLVPQTLGMALKAAGAVNAMQMDINPFWVRFTVFKPTVGGTYYHQSLFSKMFDGGKNYLNGYQKDFFYLYQR